MRGKTRVRRQAFARLLVGTAIIGASPVAAQEADTAADPAEAEAAPAPEATGEAADPASVSAAQPAQDADATADSPAPQVAAPVQTPAQATPQPAPAASAIPDPAPIVERQVRSITVEGNQRIEAETVRSYVGLEPGETYDRNRLDQAVKALYATDLFADATIRDRNGDLLITVRENPVINRILLEGNERVKDDKIAPEIRLAPRQIFTRAKARADVARIVELYRRQGRFAASVEPMIVPLDQNRVDVVFEITEGPKSKVRRINFIGNEEFSDGDLRGEIATREAKWYRLFTSNDTYDPDRSAYDSQVLRQFYLTEGYADFRVVSSTAELAPDNEDFILTYVVEEGERYRFGDIEIDSEVRDIREEVFRRLVPIQEGDWYNAKTVEDTITSLTETAGLLGYAFAEVQPVFDRDRENLKMNVTFVIRETPRVYVERIDIKGNTITKDQVIRREFRLAEGDAFNTFLVKRSEGRIQSLGFFQEDLEVEQKPGSTPDQIILEVNAQEKATGELSLSAGFSSLERFLVAASIRQRNFRGMGQELRASVNYSQFSQSVELGFTEPYLFGRNLALGFDVFRRDFNSFRFLSGGKRDTTYEQTTTGMQLRTGFPITEFISASVRYGLSLDDITLAPGQYFTDSDNDGVRGEDPADTCDPLIAGRFLCDAIGERTTSALGYSLAFDNTDNRIRPTRGQRLVLNQDIAGVGGGVQYVRTQVDADKYWRLGRSDFILNVGVEGGYITPFGGDEIRINDRFFLGEPKIRGFDIRGVGPRVIRTVVAPAEPTDDGAFILTNPQGEPFLDADGDPVYVVDVEADGRSRRDDALGGQTYYLARAELFAPVSSGLADLGIRPSVFVDVGAVFDLDFDPEEDLLVNPPGNNFVPFREQFVGDTASPRVSVGIGAAWNSPFGPVRFDLAKAIVKQPGDDTQLFQFNVGTTF